MSHDQFIRHYRRGTVACGVRSGRAFVRAFLGLSHPLETHPILASLLSGLAAFGVLASLVLAHWPMPVAIAALALPGTLLAFVTSQRASDAALELALRDGEFFEWACASGLLVVLASDEAQAASPAATVRIGPVLQRARR